MSAKRYVNLLINSISKLKDILKTIEKIMEIFNTPVNIMGQEFFVTASMGSAIHPLDGQKVCWSKIKTTLLISYKTWKNWRYISSDDLGTEYSYLSRLNMLPIDRIKMDIRFVRGIKGNDKNWAIVDIILNLAKNLDINVIAEGVENETQLEFLSKRMCDEVQGFYFYKPMSAEEVEVILVQELNNK